MSALQERVAEAGGRLVVEAQGHGIHSHALAWTLRAGCLDVEVRRRHGNAYDDADASQLAADAVPGMLERLLDAAQALEASGAAPAGQRLRVLDTQGRRDGWAWLPQAGGGALTLASAPLFEALFELQRGTREAAGPR